MTDRDRITRTRARASGAVGQSPTTAVHYRILSPDSEREQCSDHEMHEGRKQTGRRSAHAGSRLKLSDVPGRSRLIRQPSSRTGENPPYGMIGGIEETSASFEARSAPRSYPTHLGVRQESWQRIGGESPPRGRSSQPPRPRVMHEVLLARAAVKRSQGRPRAKY